MLNPSRLPPWTRHLVNREERVRTTWRLRLALLALVLFALWLTGGRWSVRISRGLVCEADRVPSDAFLVENLDSDYRLFERATAFDAFFLEYDDARSGSFEPLAAAPDDKQVVHWLVSTKTPRLETPDELRGRIDDAARFFARDQLGLSTQCGFASIAAGNPITEADEERKLRLVADTAHAVWD